MRSQESRLINVEITRRDGYTKTGAILPEEELNLKEKGFKIKRISNEEVKEGKIKELKAKRQTKELK